MIEINSSRGNYKVHFCGLEDIQEEIRPSDLIIMDENVAYTKAIRINKENRAFLVEASEEAKSFENLLDIISYVQENMRKNQRIVAIGGGITQDIAGFIASIMFRGVEWVFVPTTLLAQADSCIGGKTSINLKGVKNQLGNFYPPSEIYIAEEFLETLEEEDLVSGIGECLHYILVSSYTDCYEFIPQMRPWGRKPESMNYQRLVGRCLEIKKEYIEKDEFDKNERLILNYGHTFGHALEAQEEIEISHGRAVAFGMVVANNISEKLGIATSGTFKNYNEVLESFYDIDSIDLESYIEALRKDKKNTDDNLTCILGSDVGNMTKHVISYQMVTEVLQDMGLVKKPAKDETWTQ